ncbi:MAG: PQQ-binding-like beta-propeller repeat protein [Acidobacteria bacterium]|nr:PQQ-binding-like beta-propeller repeat protein [Acidobacteriota bacterium]
MARRSADKVATMISRSLLVVLLAIPAIGPAMAEDWTRFRGPNGSGIAAGEGYPDELDPAKNALWRTAARPGKSSPVLTDGLIFLTAFDDERLYTQCFSRDTGELLWERSVERNREAELNKLNEPAAISPVTDGANVYVFFRDVGLLSYDPAGALRWKTPLGPFANSMGHGSSPVFVDGRILVQADQKLGSYVAALNASNGEIEWKTEREEGEGWATPLLFKDRLVTISRGWIGAHALDDGRRLWGSKTLSPALVASPVAVDDRVYAFGYGNAASTDWEKSFRNRDADGDGFVSGKELDGQPFLAGIAKYEGNRDDILALDEFLAAARATEAPSSMVAFRLEDDPTAPPVELWRHERAFNGVIPSALIYRDVVYLIKNGGILETLDAATGESLKMGRLRDAIAGYSASPVAADGKVYMAGEDGKVSVLKAGGDWQALSTSDFGEEIYATPALSGGKVYLRTQEALYCLGAGR